MSYIFMVYLGIYSLSMFSCSSKQFSNVFPSFYKTHLNDSEIKWAGIELNIFFKIKKGNLGDSFWFGLAGFALFLIFNTLLHYPVSTSTRKIIMHWESMFSWYFRWEWNQEVMKPFSNSLILQNIQLDLYIQIIWILIKKFDRAGCLSLDSHLNPNSKTYTN